MKIFKDIITGDEMFSDTYPMKLIDGVVYEITGKLVQRTEGDILIEGFNPSAEGGDDEGADAITESGVDVVLNNRLVETYAFPDKKSYTLYLKDYMKRLVDKLNERSTSQEEIDLFKKNINNVMKDVLGRFKELQFFTGSSMDCDGMVALMEYREIGNQSVPTIMFFKHGLEEEKL